VAPGFLLRYLVNPFVRRLGLAPMLGVTGRRTGRLIVTPIGPPFVLDGVGYLVSGRGETHWVRNLRAARLGTLRTRGGVHAFRARELLGAERDAVVAAYRRRLGHRVDSYFERIPNFSDHPVFRLDPREAGPR
jgi:deazaflavin-dependent oxidoreductase (nitroreductase family)